MIKLYDTNGRIYWVLSIWYLIGTAIAIKVIYDALQFEKWYKKDFNLI